ncbi:MAG: cation diffusion facilitator family transporter [Candidatus Polarisedimenticolaceae bacterium]|nr:cation diffusion facilitator family transporter [Candidatus Polarisedimenticolaceae bacterium]
MGEITQSARQRSETTQKVALVGAAVNALLSVVKIFVGIVGQSQSLVADGIHSASDLLSDGLVYFVSRRSHHAPDAEHPYGHGRFETMATMALGGFLIIVAVGIVWDAFLRMFSPEKLLEPSAITLIAAAFSILANEGLFQYTFRIGREIKSNLLVANAWHHRSDAVSSIVVLVGIAGTMAGLPYLDAVAAIGVGLMIGKIGWSLGWGAAQELLDLGLSDERIALIQGIIRSIDGAEDFHLLRTRSLGGHAAVDVHVRVASRLSVSEGHMISLVIEQRLKKELKEVEDVTVHIDAEDDESAIRSEGLPLRAEVMAMLDQCWQDIPAVASRDRIVLHYLDGKIEVELFFPREQLVQLGDIERLESALQQALSNNDNFGKVRVYFG